MGWDGKQDVTKRMRDIAVYKPNPKKTGSVAQFKLSSNRDCMFVEVANQIAPKDSSAPYDWANKIIVKLGDTDICKFLAYFNLNRPGAPLKLYHRSPDGTNKTIEIKWQEFNGKESYYLSISHQKIKGERANRVSIPIGLDEIEYLKIGFRKALEIFLEWN